MYQTGRTVLASPAALMVLPLFQIPIIGTVAIHTAGYLLHHVPSMVANATIKSFKALSGKAKKTTESSVEMLTLIVTLDNELPDVEIVDIDC